MKVLVVEDELLIASFLAKALRRAGHQVFMVDAGTAALESVRTANPPYELLVLDLGLPDLDGLDVLGRLRSDGFALPVIVATARALDGDEHRARELGVTAYLTKPFPVAALLELVPASGPGPKRPEGGPPEGTAFERSR